MNEVEKLYKNAGVEPKYKDYRTKNGKTYEDKNPNNRNIRLLYPPFTADKQLELIKWLARFNWRIIMVTKADELFDNIILEVET